MVIEEILNFLKKGQDYVSGEEVSRKLNISRAAIWKHIQELRDFGYDIAAVPHLGYKLVSVPDRLFPWEIRYNLLTHLVSGGIHYFDSLSSTMDKAVVLAFNTASEGTLVIAEGQTKGRGRMGREWVSQKYRGIYFSLIIKPMIMPQQSPVLTLISAVAICEAIRKYLFIDAQIKWPNDILINNKKVGGILTELNAEMDMVHAVIIGVGINVNNDKKSLPYSAASLREVLGRKINRLSLLQEILQCFSYEYAHFQKMGVSQVLDKWRKYSATLGRRVALAMNRDGGPYLVGEAVDIDNDGGLLVRQDSGLIERVMAGDITHCKR